MELNKKEYDITIKLLYFAKQELEDTLKYYCDYNEPIYKEQVMEEFYIVERLIKKLEGENYGQK